MKIPHIVDPRTGPVTKIPAVVDETLSADIEAMNRRLVENGHAHESTFFRLPETFRDSSVEPVSDPATDDAARRRNFDPERHSRERSSGL